MEIDLVYVLQPAVVIAMTAALLLYMRKRGGMSLPVLAYSLAAYAIAILVKYIFQHYTAAAIISSGNPYLEGLYYGLQTSILEVGLAYLFARYAISRKRMTAGQGFGYGAGLAFWENGILLGVISLVNLIGIYAALQPGVLNATAYQATVDAISRSEPALFYPIAQALQSIGLGILERVSSILIHVAWGYLVFAAAIYRKRRYLAMALPMGLVDFFVPFAGVLGVATFEVLVFAISIISLAVALAAAMTINEEIAARGRAWPRKP